MTTSNDTSKHSIGFMMSTTDSNKKKGTRKFSYLNIITLALFHVVLSFILVSLVSPYWLGLREPWIERMLVPKQYQIDPEKHNAWIGLYISCNTENQCQSGTPFDDLGWHRSAQVLYALGFSVLLVAVIMGDVYACCVFFIRMSTKRFVYTISGVAMVGVILCSISLGIYGTSTLNNGILTPMSLNGPGGVLAWAYFLGIVGVALSGGCSFLFLIDAMTGSFFENVHFKGASSLQKQSNA